MGKKLTPEQIPPDAPVIPTTASSFREIREGQVFGLVCKKCGKIQYRRFTRKNIMMIYMRLKDNVKYLMVLKYGVKMSVYHIYNM